MEKGMLELAADLKDSPEFARHRQECREWNIKMDAWWDGCHERARMQCAKRNVPQNPQTYADLGRPL